MIAGKCSINKIIIYEKYFVNLRNNKTMVENKIMLLLLLAY